MSLLQLRLPSTPWTVFHRSLLRELVGQSHVLRDLHSQTSFATALLEGPLTPGELGVIVVSRDKERAMASQLPGFYFDENKRKYFKILPNHQAPQGAKYSKEAIKKASRKHRVSLMSP